MSSTTLKNLTIHHNEKSKQFTYYDKSKQFIYYAKMITYYAKKIGNLLRKEDIYYAKKIIITQK
jgi:hypothetical protein